MIINSINNVTRVRNYTTVKNNRQQSQIKNTEVQNKDVLPYPKNYRPSFGLFSKKANNLGNIKIEPDELLYKRIEEKIREREKERKSEIEELSFKYHLPFNETEKLYNGFLKIAFIEPQYNDDEIGFNSIIGHDKEKCKLASDFITPLVSIEKGLGIRNKNVPNGVLLYGIPGSGKTYMAEKTCEHLEHFGVNVENIKFSPNHQKNAELITETFEKGKERFKNTGKYTVINFLTDIDNYFMNKSSSSKMEPEQVAFMNCSSDCAKEGVTWIGTSNDPKQLNVAILMSDRAEIKIPVGRMENYAIPEILRFSLIKNGQKMYIKEIDFQKILETIENDFLSFTPADIKEIISETVNKKIHPDMQLTTADLIKEMHNYNKNGSSGVQINELVGLMQDTLYVDYYDIISR